MSDRVHRLLARLAERASDDPGYWGWVLDRYRVSEAMSVSTLAAFLGIAEDSLPSLRLCLRPRAERFGADVLAVAANIGADATALAAVVRQVDAVDAMSAGGNAVNDRGFLLAARARDTSHAAERNLGDDHGAASERSAAESGGRAADDAAPLSSQDPEEE